MNLLESSEHILRYIHPTEIGRRQEDGIELGSVGVDAIHVVEAHSHVLWPPQLQFGNEPRGARIGWTTDYSRP
jgi:hypothetical protein